MKTQRTSSGRTTRPKSARQGVKKTIPTKALRIRRILLPVDFSDSSREALTQAVGMAKQFRARLYPLHVLEPVVYPSDMAFAPMAPEFPAGISVASMRRKLKAWCEDLVPSRMIGKIEIRVGQAYYEITEAATDLNVDMIVISTHGYTGLKHVFLGSTAERIVRHAPCPVLTVRQKA